MYVCTYVATYILYMHALFALLLNKSVGLKMVNHQKLFYYFPTLFTIHIPTAAYVFTTGEHCLFC